MLHIPFTSDPSTFLTVRDAEAEALLLEVLTQFGIGVALLTEEGATVFWNARAASLTNASLSEINATGLVHVFEPPQRMAHLIAQAKRGVSSVGERLQIHRADGGGQPVVVWCLPLRREDSAETRIIVVMREVQDAEPHSESSYARERLHLLGQIAGVVFHEIQNPLNAISLHTDILEEELAQPDGGNRTQLLDSLGVVRARIGHLHELVQEYLTLARLAVLPREPEDLGALLEALALEMRDMLMTRGVTLRLEEVAGGQVALHKPSFDRALRKMVQHVLDTIPQGGVLIMRVRRTDAQIHLDISETDSGAAAGQAALLSHPFPPIESEKAQLGLSLAREVVIAHRGDITVKHESGVGTTLTITLPLLATGEVQEG